MRSIYGYTQHMWQQKTTEEIFNTAYDEYADALFRHAAFRLSHHERALELVQDTFMKAWDVLQKGTKVKNIRALLYRILNNLIIDEYRKKKQESLDGLLEKDGVSEGSFAELQSSSLSDMVQGLDLKRSARYVHAALSKLQENYRQVLIMRYIDELKIKEIARILSESQNVISVRINRALKKLREILIGNKALLNI